MTHRPSWPSWFGVDNSTFRTRDPPTFECRPLETISGSTFGESCLESSIDTCLLSHTCWHNPDQNYSLKAHWGDWSPQKRCPFRHRAHKGRCCWHFRSLLMGIMVQPWAPRVLRKPGQWERRGGERDWNFSSCCLFWMYVSVCALLLSSGIGLRSLSRIWLPSLALIGHTTDLHSFIFELMRKRSEEGG